MKDSTQTGSNIFKKTSEERSFAKKRQVLVLVFCCLIMGTLVYSVTPVQGGATDLWGNIVSEKDVRNSVIKTLTLFIPVLSFFVGLMVSLIPYRKRRYMDKYVPFSLIIILIIYSALFVVRIISSF